MIVRKGKTSDSKILLKILKGAHELQAGDGVGVYNMSWIKDVLSKQGDNFVFILEDNNKIIGFIHAHYLKSVKQIIINDLYIDFKHRKKGLVIKLIKEIEKIAKLERVKNITGLVQTSNIKMQCLFNKLKYKKGESLYFYEKLLK